MELELALTTQTGREDTLDPTHSLYQLMCHSKKQFKCITITKPTQQDSQQPKAFKNKDTMELQRRERSCDANSGMQRMHISDKLTLTWRRRSRLPNPPKHGRPRTPAQIGQVNTISKDDMASSNKFNTRSPGVEPLGALKDAGGTCGV